jgi:hypothetical protein
VVSTHDRSSGPAEGQDATADPAAGSYRSATEGVRVSAGSDGVLRLDVVPACPPALQLHLLLDATLPAVRRLRDRGLHASLRSAGRHDGAFRIRLSGPVQVVRPAAREVAAELRAVLAMRLLEGPATAQVPDGHVLIEPVPDSDAIPGRCEEALAAAVGALQVSAEHLCDGEGTAQDRVQLAMTAMVVQALAHPLGLPRGHLALRAWAEDFCRGSDPEGGLRDVCASVWSARRRNVLETVQELAAGTPDPIGDVWRSWAEQAWVLCGAPPTEAGPPSRRLAVVGSGASDEESRTGRCGVEVLGELLAVLGVTTVERFLAAHLVVEATERVIGQRWVARWTSA